MASVRVSSLFVVKFEEALRRLEEQKAREYKHCSECDEPWVEGAIRCAKCGDEDSRPIVWHNQPTVPRKLAIEEFLEELRPDLLEALVGGSMAHFIEKTDGPSERPAS